MKKYEVKVDVVTDIDNEHTIDIFITCSNFITRSLYSGQDTIIVDGATIKFDDGTILSIKETS